MAPVAVMPASQESAADMARRLADLIDGADQHSLPDALRDQIAVLLDALRSRIVRKPERDHRSLFELDDRMIELMSQVEEATEAGTEITAELAEEIEAYLEAHRRKVDRIAGYWRWQQSIADICGKEADRLSARKRAADNRVTRLKGFLMGFMTSRGIKKLEGERADIAIQRNSSAALSIDNPLQLPEQYLERSLRLTMPEWKTLAGVLSEGDLARRVRAALKSPEWETNGDAIRAAILTGANVASARLVTGYHVRIR